MRQLAFRIETYGDVADERRSWACTVIDRETRKVIDRVTHTTYGKACDLAKRYGHTVHPQPHELAPSSVNYRAKS